MLTFDGEYVVRVHFEITDEQALENGGIDMDTVKNGIKDLPDWILLGVTDNIDLRDNDTVLVLPSEGKLMKDGEVLEEAYGVQ